jgi:diaminohydroxyphosphoribosylaminopyrimidine deaminase/5-amino-6-(5-phosphoribosylamino)uracil reductase
VTDLLDFAAEPRPLDPLAADSRFMASALAYGRRWLGQAAPNPAVGALVVKDGRVVGRGATAPGGRPHAEVLALADAGEAARGADLYVTLEPCSHHGKTPPCADAIVAAGLARVVSALEDPDPRVSGHGHARLRAAGVVVEVGVLADEARRAHLGHILRQRENRPAVLLKLAQTSDGYAAGGRHDPRLRITGALADARVHMLRALSDAIMVGVGTAQADDPLMTVRLPGMEDRKPLRVVLDARLDLSPRSRLAATAREFPTLVLAGDGADPARREALEAAGVEIAPVSLHDGRVDLRAALGLLAARGVTRVMSEGGPAVGSALIEQGLADEVVLVTNPTPLARHGVPALEASARARLADPAFYAVLDEERVGHDLFRRHEKV